MAITHYLPVGTTEAQTFQALIDDTATDLSGGSLTLEAVDKLGRVVTITGTVAFSDATVGKWTYTPDGQLTPRLSPYAMRLKLDLSGVAKFPNGKDADTWHIVR